MSAHIPSNKRPSFSKCWYAVLSSLRLSFWNCCDEYKTCLFQCMYIVYGNKRPIFGKCRYGYFPNMSSNRFDRLVFCGCYHWRKFSWWLEEIVRRKISFNIEAKKTIGCNYWTEMAFIQSILINPIEIAYCFPIGNYIQQYIEEIITFYLVFVLTQYKHVGYIFKLLRPSLWLSLLSKYNITAVI